MPETELIILILAVGFLALLVWLTGRILSRLARIERRLSQFSAAAQSSDDDAAAIESSPGGLFESFLAEDPSRRSMPKSEQFAAFRKWRKDKGLSWSSGT